jgi:hypothetical protein
MPLQRDNLFLYNNLELEKDPGITAGMSPLERSAYETIVQWTRDFLCQPHHLLGREGPVCPFTQPSLNRHLFWMTVMPEADIDVEKATRAVELLRDWFSELEPRSGPDVILKTILIIFPELSHEKARDQLESLQRKLKPEFVKKGIMVGQFYEGCPESGLWSEEFHPLQSPLPLLAIRNMVPSDFPFLHGKRGNSGMLIAYLNRFGTNIPPEVKRLMVEALESSDLSLRPKKTKKEPVAR